MEDKKNLPSGYLDLLHYYESIPQGIISLIFLIDLKIVPENEFETFSKVY